MIPLPYWLTNVQFVIGAIGTFAFFAAAWLNIDSWTIRREYKTGFRAVGFLCMAIWSALFSIGFNFLWSDIMVAATLFAGISTVAISFIIDTPPLQPKELAELRKKQSAPLPQQESTPTDTKKSPAIAAQVNPLRGSVNLRSKTSVSKPIEKRRFIRAFVNTVVGLILFSLIGWGAYVGFKRFTPGSANDETMPGDAVNKIIIEPEELSEESIPPSPEPQQEEVKEGDASDLPTVTIKETEVGYLNVREGPNTSEGVITKIKPGESYVLLETNEKSTWYKIELEDEAAGWISSKYANKD